MAAITTHEKLVGLENRIIKAKAALRDGDKVKAYKCLDIAERDVDELDRFDWAENISSTESLQDFLNDLEDKGWDVEGVEFFKHNVIVISTRREYEEKSKVEPKGFLKKNKDWKPIGDGRRIDGRRMGGRINRIG